MIFWSITYCQIISMHSLLLAFYWATWTSAMTFFVWHFWWLTDVRWAITNVERPRKWLWSSTCWIHFLQQQNQSTPIFCHTHGLWRAVLEPCFPKSFSKNKDNTFMFLFNTRSIWYISLLNSITFFLEYSIWFYLLFPPTL